MTTRPTIPVHSPVMRHLRRMMGLSIADLADEVALSASYVRSLENGVRTAVHAAAFDRLCHSLRVQDRRVLMAYPNGPVPGATDTEPDDSTDGQPEPAAATTGQPA